LKSLVGQNISLKAEGDTTLRGATATADRIDVKTGGTLTIESLQDMAESMSKNSQVGGRAQISFGTAWSADGYASGGKSNGSYQGVGQQSSLFAGDAGYHVDAGHVNLVGGAIPSTNATNSELTAQTLTFSYLQNQMQHSTSSGGISGGYGGAMEGNTPVSAGATPNFGGGVPMNEKDGDSSTTYATLISACQRDSHCIWGPPQTVAMTNQLGVPGWDVAGSGFIFRPKSTRGPANVDGGSTQVVLIKNSAANLTKPTPTTGACFIPTSEGGLRQQSCNYA